MQSETIAHIVGYISLAGIVPTVFYSGVLWNKVNKIEAWVINHDKLSIDQIEVCNEMRITIGRLEEKIDNNADRLDRLNETIKEMRDG